jgi:hypothetical protein
MNTKHKCTRGSKILISSWGVPSPQWHPKTTPKMYTQLLQIHSTQPNKPLGASSARTGAPCRDPARHRSHGRHRKPPLRQRLAPRRPRAPTLRRPARPAELVAVVENRLHHLHGNGYFQPGLRPALAGAHVPRAHGVVQVRPHRRHSVYGRVYFGVGV